MYKIKYLVHFVKHLKTWKCNLLIVFDFLLRAYDAELLSLLIGLPEISLGHPHVKQSDAVHTNEQYGIRHQLGMKKQ